MIAADLISRLQARGATLQVRGDTLWVRPRRVLTDDDRTLIRRHKPQLLITLRRRLEASVAELPNFHLGLYQVVHNAQGPDAAAEILPALVLGGRLARGEVSALRCGITGRPCRACAGIPCDRSEPWQ